MVRLSEIAVSGLGFNQNFMRIRRDSQACPLALVFNLMGVHCVCVCVCADLAPKSHAFPTLSVVSMFA
jgi:hypothetical protein